VAPPIPSSSTSAAMGGGGDEEAGNTAAATAPSTPSSSAALGGGGMRKREARRRPWRWERWGSVGGGGGRGSGDWIQSGRGKRVADCVRGGAWERSRARRVRKADARVGGRPARADGKEDGILSPLHSF
jgi:hypothetical protein